MIDGTIVAGAGAIKGLKGQTMNLTEYLFQRLRELGVDRTFGIPGDFVLPFYAMQERLGMATVVCAHEPGVGFAADAYARFRGIGVAVATYGPGALNMVNPVACAYAERSPLLVISGGPEIALRRPELNLHHLIKTYDSQLRIYREVTIDAAILDDPISAPAAIDRVLRRVLASKRPGYLEVPRDRVAAEVEAPRGPLLSPILDESRAARAGALDEALAEIGAMLESARRPALYVGVDVRRRGLSASIVRLAERLRLPAVGDLLGKAAFPESHPQYAGVYLGALGDPAVRDLVDGSDCVLEIGVVPTDLGTGFWTERIDARARIVIGPDRVQVRYHYYDGLPMEEVVSALLERLPESDRPAPRFDTARRGPLADAPGPAAPASARPPALSPSRSGTVRVADAIAVLRKLDQSRYSFVADVGDAWFIGVELRVDVFVAAGYYSSMGFAVPAALGAGLAEPARRPFVLVGDGAFQMTGTELATHAEQGVRPIVLLLNNEGYGMLEAVDRPRGYFERPSWDYTALARSLGAEAEQARSAEELRAALARAENAPGPYLIEAFTARDDLSPVMARLRDRVKSAFRISTGD